MLDGKLPTFNSALAEMAARSMRAYLGASATKTGRLCPPFGQLLILGSWPLAERQDLSMLKAIKKNTGKVQKVTPPTELAGDSQELCTLGDVYKAVAISPCSLFINSTSSHRNQQKPCLTTAAEALEPAIRHRPMHS